LKKGVARPRQGGGGRKTTHWGGNASVEGNDDINRFRVKTKKKEGAGNPRRLPRKGGGEKYKRHFLPFDVKKKKINKSGTNLKKIRKGGKGSASMTREGGRVAWRSGKGKDRRKKDPRRGRPGQTPKKRAQGGRRRKVVLER